MEDLANLKVTDARTGDVLSIAGAGDRMTDLDYTVDRGTRLEAGARTWVELSGPYMDRRVSLRVGGDEEVEVFLHSGPRKVALEDLGLSEDDLAQMDERQNPADSFDFDGVTWMYRLSREVRAWRDNQPAPTGFYYWEFFTQDGKRAAGNPQGRRRAVHGHAVDVGQCGRRHGLPQDVVDVPPMNAVNADRHRVCHRREAAFIGGHIDFRSRQII